MSHVYLSRDQEVALIKDLMKQFPAEFGLRSWPQERFRISERDSLWSSGEGCILLYTEILSKDGQWKSFAKGTVAELRESYFPLR